MLLSSVLLSLHLQPWLNVEVVTAAVEASTAVGVAASMAVVEVSVAVAASEVPAVGASAAPEAAAFAVDERQVVTE